jgi:hypothetical protein
MPKHKEGVNRACHHSSKLIIKFFSKERKNGLELAVSQQQETAIQEDSGVRIVLLVAGAGFTQDPTIGKWV